MLRNGKQVKDLIQSDLHILHLFRETKLNPKCTVNTGREIIPNDATARHYIRSFKGTH
jgi:hypothetical protein